MEIKNNEPLKRTFLWMLIAVLLGLLLAWISTEGKIIYETPITPTTKPIQGPELEPIDDGVTTTEFIKRAIKRATTVVRIESFFETRNPDMVWTTPILVDACDLYGCDPYLLVAIGALESGNYTSYLCGYGNCWGINSSTGYVRFESFSEGAAYTARLLGSRYAGMSIEEMGAGYKCGQPCDASEWINSVRSIYDEL